MAWLLKFPTFYLYGAWFLKPPLFSCFYRAWLLNFSSFSQPYSTWLLIFFTFPYPHGAWLLKLCLSPPREWLLKHPFLACIGRGCCIYLPSPSHMRHGLWNFFPAHMVRGFLNFPSFSVWLLKFFSFSHPYMACLPQHHALLRPPGVWFLKPLTFLACVCHIWHYVAQITHSCTLFLNATPFKKAI